MKEELLNELLEGIFSELKGLIFGDFKEKEYSVFKTTIEYDKFDSAEIVTDIMNGEKAHKYLVIIQDSRKLELDFFTHSLRELGYNSFEIIFHEENKCMIRVETKEYY